MSANYFLTVHMIAAETARLMANYMVDDDDGLYGMRAMFPISDETLGWSLDEFSEQLLQPALLAAWNERKSPDTDQVMKLPNGCVASLIPYEGFEVLAIRAYLAGTDHDAMTIDVRRGCWQ